MYACSQCGHTTRSLIGYAKHYRIHRNVSNVPFPCGVTNCPRQFRTYSAFNSHITRDHGNLRNLPSQFNAQINSIGCFGSFVCPLTFCRQECDDLQKFLKHLKDHLGERIEISCPFSNCTSRFKVKSSFTSHLSRCHRKHDMSQIDKSLIHNTPASANEEENSSETLDDQISNPESYTIMSQMNH